MHWETGKEREESRIALRLVTSRSPVTSTMLMPVGRSFPEALNIFLFYYFNKAVIIFY